MLILYGTDGCHLCHDAQSLLKTMGMTWQDVDIMDHDDLLESYGPHIPVLQQQGRNLNWPFQQQDVLRFLETKAS